MCSIPLWCSALAMCAYYVFVLLWVETEIETPRCGLWHEYQICAWCLAEVTAIAGAIISCVG